MRGGLCSRFIRGIGGGEMYIPSVMFWEAE